MTTIIDIIGREILDSRGNPTVEVDVTLEDGAFGRAAVPSGASTGAHEAVELSDGVKDRYLGKGVEGAVANVNGALRDAVEGMDAEDQVAVDRRMIDVDGTPNKSRLGANAILGVSLAVAKAAADSAGLPLYRYVGGIAARVLPVPLMNIINGGAHADNPIDFQEFMIVPAGARTMADAVRMGAEVFHALKAELKAARHNTNVGDEGGFAPNLPGAEAALEFIMAAVAKAGYAAGRDIFLALDCAATEFFKNGAYRYEGEGAVRSPDEQARYLARLVADFPIISIEDGMAEDDWDGWKILTELIGARCQLVGDDLFVTNTARLGQGIERHIANADAGQGQPDRLAQRNLGRRRHGAARRLPGGDVASLRRDRGFDHRRPRGRHQLRSDQNRLAGPLRPHRQIQSAVAHRRGTRAGWPLCGTFHSQQVKLAAALPQWHGTA